MAGTDSAKWHKKPSSHHILRRYTDKREFATHLEPRWVGISIVVYNSSNADVAIAIHDGVYHQDFCVKSIYLNEHQAQDHIADYVVGELKAYAHSHLVKFIGAGIPRGLRERSPTLMSRLWLELDVVPISIMTGIGKRTKSKNSSHWHVKCVDEQADSMARKCVMLFGPKLSPLLQVGYRGLVEVDSDSQVELVTLRDYRKTCSPQTWEAMIKYSNSLKGKNKKIAFFSSTPQGGGVALMRHALVRLAKLLGVDLKWYVPKPKPEVFWITKTIHNILQGVSKPDEKISKEQKRALDEWIEENANRYWLSPGGPLRPPSEGGADVIMIDDPQMPRLISLVKDLTPNRPVLFRSHIQIRSDLVNQEGTPQADVWGFLWNNIKRADMFISHPIPSFVPKIVPAAKVAYMPATTDWLDGLNKDIDEWDRSYYRNLYNRDCFSSTMTKLKGKKYIIQIARFDPAKGIDDVIESYAEFRRRLEKHDPKMEAPQLVIAGNSSIDDPDGPRIYEETMKQLETKHAHLVSSVSVMRLNANDQLLNTLLSDSHIVLQLSTREGFEVKVSEAIHKGKPVIATKAGGIPLQVQDGKNGFLVETGDWKAVAGHLFDLWTNAELYEEMSDFAEKSVSDEVGTVGNALAWLYLAEKWCDGQKVVPEGKWVNDLAREAAGKPYEKQENRLPRSI